MELIVYGLRHAHNAGEMSELFSAVQDEDEAAFVRAKYEAFLCESNGWGAEEAARVATRNIHLGLTNFEPSGALAFYNLQVHQDD